jgi:hypothetical protein
MSEVILDSGFWLGRWFVGERAWGARVLVYWCITNTACACRAGRFVGLARRCKSGYGRLITKYRKANCSGVRTLSGVDTHREVGAETGVWPGICGDGPDPGCAWLKPRSVC